MTSPRPFCYGEAHHHLLVIFLVIEAILFGLFTMCMIGDQWTTISSNQTQIDRLKNTKYQYQEEVNEVCGSPSHVNFSWSWFLPIAVKFSDDLKHRIYGFRLEESEEVSPLIRSLSANDHAAPAISGGSTRNSRENLEDGSNRRLQGRKSSRDKVRIMHELLHRL